MVTVTTIEPFPPPLVASAVTCQPFPFELGSDRGVDRSKEAMLLLDHEIARRTAHNCEIIRIETVRFAIHGDEQLTTVDKLAEMRAREL